MKKPEQYAEVGLYKLFQREDGLLVMEPQEMRLTKMVCMMCGYEAKDCDDIFHHCLFNCSVMQREWEGKA